ncbi:hypothetical protein CC79DRAFT_1351820 [Sarocladium strictum]
MAVMKIVENVDVDIPLHLSHKKNPFRNFAFHLRTLWLFTKSDMPTSTGTNTTFALAGILATGYTVHGNPVFHWTDIVKGIFVSFCFTWHLTLCFNLGNQRQPDSITEDGINKPWRPIPAGRISPELTLAWQLVSIISLLGICATLTGSWQESWWQRTLINACGITTNRAASLRVAIAVATYGSGYEVRFTDKMLGWLLICAAIVSTTIQVQDLRDQKGDAEIDRSTMPLLIGDMPTRYMTIAAAFFWSVACPLYWDLGILGYLLPLLATTAVSAFMLIHRNPRSDHLSFRFIGCWWVLLYFLPVMKVHGY